MRVSDRSTARNYLKYLNGARTNYAKTSQQIFSGNRFERLSDDVSSGTRVMRTRMDLYKTQVHLDNVKSVNEEMTTAESAMTSVNDILASAHSLALKAMNEDKMEVGKDAIATEIKNLKEQMLTLANSKFGKKYTFGGSNASPTAPFTADANGKLSYNGIPVDIIQKDATGYFHMDGTTRKEIPMDEKVFMDIGLGIRLKEDQVDGDTAFQISQSGLDIFGFGTTGTAPDLKSNNMYNVLTDLENSIRNYDAKKIGDIDTQLTTITDKYRANLSDIGSKTKFLDTIQGRLETSVVSHKTRISDLMGTNDAEASTALTMNESVLKAVIQMGSRILPVSLMDFLR